MKNLFRKKIGALSLAIFMTLTLAAPLPVGAEEVSSTDLIQDATELLNSKTVLNKDDFLDLLTSDSVGTMAGITAIYDTIESVDTGVFSQLQYSVPTAVESVQILNCDYEMMKVQMREAGFGESFSLEVDELQSGYSTDITEAFEMVYGDLSSKFNAGTSLPDGWSMAEVMKKAQETRDIYASDIKETKEYMTIRQNINISGAVLQVQDALEKPEIKDSLTLKSLLDAAIGDCEVDGENWLKNNWSNESSQNKYEIMAQYKSNLALGYGRENMDQRIDGMEDVQDLFSSAKGEINTFLSANGRWISNISKPGGSMDGYINYYYAVEKYVFDRLS